MTAAGAGGEDERRALDVLERLVAGDNTTQLCAHLGMRYSTARSHIQSILDKLGVHSKLAAVAYAVEEGLLPHPAHRMAPRQDVAAIA